MILITDFTKDSADIIIFYFMLIEYATETDSKLFPLANRTTFKLV